MEMVLMWQSKAILLTAASWLVSTPPQWNATLKPTGDQKITGKATVDAVGDSAMVQVSIENAKPNHTYPWALQEGGCDAAGKVLGSAAAYQPLAAGGDGSATASATVPAKLSSGGRYAITVQAGGSPAACGELQAVGGGMKAPTP
jgi:hypothetical protein